MSNSASSFSQYYSRRYKSPNWTPVTAGSEERWVTKIKSNAFLKKSWLEKVIKYDKVGMQSTLEQLTFHSVYFYFKATIRELHKENWFSCWGETHRQLMGKHQVLPLNPHPQTCCSSNSTELPTSLGGSSNHCIQKLKPTGHSTSFLTVFLPRVGAKLGELIPVIKGKS